MSNLYKLAIFILIIFIAYFVYSQSRVDNSEPVYTPETSKVDKKQSKPRTIHKELTNSLPDIVTENITNSKEEHENIVKKSFNMALMYDTPEKVMKSIIYYQENGQEDKANEFIEYLVKNFPDYEMEK